MRAMFKMNGKINEYQNCHWSRCTWTQIQESRALAVNKYTIKT